MDMTYKRLSPPLTTCSVTLKQIDTDNVGSIGKEIFNYLLSQFGSKNYGL